MHIGSGFLLTNAVTFCNLSVVKYFEKMPKFMTYLLDIGRQLVSSGWTQIKVSNLVGFKPPKGMQTTYAHCDIVTALYCAAFGRTPEQLESMAEKQEFVWTAAGRLLSWTPAMIAKSINVEWKNPLWETFFRNIA